MIKYLTLFVVALCSLAFVSDAEATIFGRRAVVRQRVVVQRNVVRQRVVVRPFVRRQVVVQRFAQPVAVQHVVVPYSAPVVQSFVSPSAVVVEQNGCAAFFSY